MELPVDGAAAAGAGSGVAPDAAGSGAARGDGVRSSSAGGAEAGRPWTDSSTRCF